MKKLTVGLAALLMIVIASGCEDKASRTDGSREMLVDACTLLSRTEAEALVGEPLKDAEKRENKAVGDRLCLYNAVDKDSFRIVQVSVSQQALMPNNGQSPKSIYQTLKANFPDAVMVEGIGDEAFIAPPGLHILRDNYYITIAVGNSDDPKNREILKAAGKKAVDNLASSAGM